MSVATACPSGELSEAATASGIVPFDFEDGENHDGCHRSANRPRSVICGALARMRFLTHWVGNPWRRRARVAPRTQLLGDQLHDPRYRPSQRGTSSSRERDMPPAGGDLNDAAATLGTEVREAGRMSWIDPTRLVATVWSTWASFRTDPGRIV